MSTKREVYAAFIDASKRDLRDVEEQLMELQNSDQQLLDVELLATISRAVRSTGDDAKRLALSTIGEMVDEIVAVLQLLECGRLSLTTVAIDALLLSTDSLQTLVYNAEHSHARDISFYVLRLRQLAETHSRPEKWSDVPVTVASLAVIHGGDLSEHAPIVASHFEPRIHEPTSSIGGPAS